MNISEQFVSYSYSSLAEDFLIDFGSGRFIQFFPDTRCQLLLYKDTTLFYLAAHVDLGSGYCWAMQYVLI